MKKIILSLLVALTTTTGAWAQGPTTSGITWNTGTNSGTFSMLAYDVEVSTELWYKLSETGDNSSLADKTNVFLERTLQDGGWNTFCAPFDISADKVTTLGMTVKELTSATLVDDLLTLTFSDASSIEGGKPYMVKVASALDFTADGNEFEGITPDWVAEPVTFTDVVTFQPVLAPESMTADDKTKLFVKGGNSLTWPNTTANINAFRAYFQLPDGAAAKARVFTMDFGDGSTAITTVLDDEAADDEGTYDLQGRKIQGQPTVKGVYIKNRKKVIIQ